MDLSGRDDPGSYPSGRRTNVSAALASARQSFARCIVHLVLGAAVVMAVPVATMFGTAGVASAQSAPCAPPVANKVACENTRPGDADWQANGRVDSIAGFTTDISAAPRRSSSRSRLMPRPTGWICTGSGGMAEPERVRSTR